MPLSFDPSLQAFYYARAIEIPTPRWTAYEAERFSVEMSDEVPMITTERAYGEREAANEAPLRLSVLAPVPELCHVPFGRILVTACFGLSRAVLSIRMCKGTEAGPEILD